MKCSRVEQGRLRLERTRECLVEVSTRSIAHGPQSGMHISAADRIPSRSATCATHARARAVGLSEHPPTLLLWWGGIGADTVRAVGAAGHPVVQTRKPAQEGVISDRKRQRRGGGSRSGLGWRWKMSACSSTGGAPVGSEPQRDETGMTCAPHARHTTSREAAVTNRWRERHLCARAGGAWKRAIRDGSRVVRGSVEGLSCN